MYSLGHEYDEDALKEKKNIPYRIYNLTFNCYTIF